MVVNVEQGASNPSTATLLRLSHALGVGLPAQTRFLTVGEAARSTGDVPHGHASPGDGPATRSCPTVSAPRDTARSAP